MLEGGFILLHRSILRWEWYGDLNTARLFIHLLLTVNYGMCIRDRLCGLPGPCGRLAGLCNKQTHAAFIFFIGLLRKKAAPRQRIHGHTDVGFGKRAQLYDIPRRVQGRVVGQKQQHG